MPLVSPKTETELETTLIIKKDFRTTAYEKANIFSRSFFDSIQVVIVSLAVVVIIITFFAKPTVVSGSSMEPNLKTDDVIITEKLSEDFGSLKRGDIIAFHATTDKDFVKRIIGLPKDKLKIQNGKVYINGTILNEDYLSAENKDVIAGPIIKEGEEVIVPDNKFIALGDNRAVSYDSRYIGFVDKSQIIGRALVRIFPISKFEYFNSVKYNIPS